MKKFFLLFIIVVISLLAWKMFSPYIFPYKPYSPDAELVIYGRVGCPNTDKFRKDLEKNKIPYIFKDVDKEYNEEMWSIVNEVYEKPPRFLLPVIVIDGELLLNTNFDTAIKKYGKKTFIFSY